MAFAFVWLGFGFGFRLAFAFALTLALALAWVRAASTPIPGFCQVKVECVQVLIVTSVVVVVAFMCRVDGSGINFKTTIVN